MGIAMNDTLTLVLALLAGTALGAMFFGGLWWTVRRAVSASQPALWFVGSLLVRTTIALAGFFFVSGGDWQRLVACVVGFVMARHVATRLTRLPAEQAGHAP
jgi:F1F0 ATPase subunit 2